MVLSPTVGRAVTLRMLPNNRECNVDRLAYLPRDAVTLIGRNGQRMGALGGVHG